MENSRRKKLVVSVVCFCVICVWGIMQKEMRISAAEQKISERFVTVSDSDIETEDTEDTEPVLDMTKVTLKKKQHYMLFGSNIQLWKNSNI